ncbi:MAG: response regulator [Microcoleus sp. SM1_3_4]|nr:response regulator [Microcoleus sp. SM1_3_4]
MARENSQKKQQILVIDDTSTNLKLISDFLRESEFEVRVAKSGAQAMKLLETTKPDIIMLDVVMPEMDGFETCRLLKSSPQTRDIPVMFMTAVDDAASPSYKVKGLELGAVDYISKPIQLPEVLARIKTHLHLRYLTQQIEQQKELLESVF